MSTKVVFASIFFICFYLYSHFNFCRGEERAQGISERQNEGRTQHSSSNSHRRRASASDEARREQRSSNNGRRGSTGCGQSGSNSRRASAGSQSRPVRQHAAETRKGDVRSPTPYHRRGSVFERLSDMSNNSPDFFVSPIGKNSAVDAFFEGYSQPPPLPQFGSSQNLLACVGEKNVAAPPSPKTVRFESEASTTAHVATPIEAGLKEIRDEVARKLPKTATNTPLTISAALQHIRSEEKANREKEEGELTDSAAQSPVFTPPNSQCF